MSRGITSIRPILIVVLLVALVFAPARGAAGALEPTDERGLVASVLAPTFAEGDVRASRAGWRSTMQAFATETAPSESGVLSFAALLGAACALVFIFLRSPLRVAPAALPQRAGRSPPRRAGRLL